MRHIKNQSGQASTGGKEVTNFKDENGLNSNIHVTPTERDAVFENSLTAENSDVKTLVQYTDKMSIEQLNDYLVKRARVICEHVRKERMGFHTSDILPPICYNDLPLQKNIDSVLACFSNTLAAALFYEKGYIQIFKRFEALSNIVENEKYLIFDFLSKNDLLDKFNEFVKTAK